MYILYWPYNGLLHGRLYSSGSWGTQENVDSGSTVNQDAFGFSTGNSTVYGIWQEASTKNLQFASRTSTWNSPQVIATLDTNSVPRWTASYDLLQGRWYILYYNYTTNQIYQYSGVPGSWSGKTQLFTTNATSTSVYIGSFYNTGQITASKSILGIFWTQNPSTGLQLMFGNETIVQSHTTVLMKPIGARTGQLALPSWVVTLAMLTIALSCIPQLEFAKRYTQARMTRLRSRNRPPP
jgi:hypothetical protein